MEKVLDRPDDLGPSLGSRWWLVAITASVCLISWLHYITSFRSVGLHEIFQRLYYVPIVVAAVIYGVKGGLAVAGFSAILYLPHIALKWHAWPVFQLGQYGEIVVFTLVAAVTGFLADRLRTERDECRRTAVERDEACRHLEAGIEERLRADRLVTIGRLASGIAHEIRNPLGSLEILGAEIARGHPKAQFLAIAKDEIQRLDRVVTEFLDFACPAVPQIQSFDLGRLLEATAHLAAPALACRGTTLDLDIAEMAPSAKVDVDQVERALLNILLDETAVPRRARVRLSDDREDRVARIIVAVPLARSKTIRSVADMVEPFRSSEPGTGLALATARRLIENQQGTIRAEVGPTHLSYIIELPLTGQDTTAVGRYERSISRPPQEGPVVSP